MGNDKIEDRIRRYYSQVAADCRGDASADADADAALAQAQRLAAETSIDLEVLRQRAKARGQRVARPTRRRFYLAEGPYVRSRANLASRVVMAMGMCVMIAIDGSFIDVIGFSEDIEMAWQIFGLVEVQMTGAAQCRIDQGQHRRIPDPGGRSGHLSARTFKINYFTGYTERVARRIKEIRREAEQGVVFAEGVELEDGTVTGRVTGALVLVSRRAEVERRFRELYPAERFKNGRPKRARYWRAPQTSVSVDAAQWAGVLDGSRARIQLGEGVGKRRRVLR